MLKKSFAILKDIAQRASINQNTMTIAGFYKGNEWMGQPTAIYLR
jgi:hypothetical protein